MTNLRKALLSVVVVASAATAAGGGTFASFSAETTNSSNVFSTGTVELSDQVNTGTTCYSYGAGVSNSTSCTGSDQQFITATTAAKPGAVYTAHVTITNAGSLPLSDLKVWGTAACTDGNGSDGHITGTASVCQNTEWYVQETDSSFTTNQVCQYGDDTVNHVCDLTGTSYPLSKFYGVAAGGHVTSANALLISNADNGTGTAETLAVGASRYFVVGFTLPSTADNTYQNRTASFALTWHGDQ